MPVKFTNAPVIAWRAVNDMQTRATPYHRWEESALKRSVRIVECVRMADSSVINIK
jgi:hypothetical protein